MKITLNIILLFLTKLILSQDTFEQKFYAIVDSNRYNIDGKQSSKWSSKIKVYDFYLFSLRDTSAKSLNPFMQYIDYNYYRTTQKNEIEKIEMKVENETDASKKKILMKDSLWLNSREPKMLGAVILFSYQTQSSPHIDKKKLFDRLKFLKTIHRKGADSFDKIYYLYEFF